MITQVIFNIDAQLKARAMRKAQREGVPFSAVLNMATRAYVDDELHVGLIQEEKFNAKTRRMLDRELKEIKEGKNMSPLFDNAKDAIAYLQNL